MSLFGMDSLNDGKGFVNTDQFTNTIKNKVKNMATNLIGKNKYEDEDIRLWREYKAGNKQAGWQLLDRFKATLGQHTQKFSNALPRAVVEAKLKTYAMAAFDTYNPEKGTKLSTHVYNYLQQINRDNYKHQQAIRLPENIARGYGRFMEGKGTLFETLGREPTTAELANHLGWSVDATHRAEHKYHNELVEGKQEFSSATIGPDIGQSALRFAYDDMTDDERFILEHKIGYMNKRVLPAGSIREQLKCTSHRFNQLQKSMEAKVQDAYLALSKEEG